MLLSTELDVMNTCVYFLVRTAMCEHLGQSVQVLYFFTGKQRRERFLYSFCRNPSCMKTVSKEMVLLSTTISIHFPSDRNIVSEILALCEHYEPCLYLFVYNCMLKLLETTVNCVNNGGKINDILHFSSAVVPCPTVQISGTHISLHTHWTWCYRSIIRRKVYVVKLLVCIQGN